MNCYAERFAARFSKPGERYHGLVTIANGHPQWTGKMVTADFDENSVLWQPCRWRKPRMIFVNSMSDLFHKDVPFEFIDAVMGIVALCPRHTFQVLTKRPERMAEYFARFKDKDPAEELSNVESDTGCIWGDEAACAISNSINGVLGEGHNVGWPMKNLWLGTSVEDQTRANERIPHLLEVPTAVRWLSVEPLLGPIDLAEAHRTKRKLPNFPKPTRVDWIVVGGESGPCARPMRLEWARSIVKQCKAVNVPVFVKQLGGNITDEDQKTIQREAKTSVHDRKGGDINEFPPDLRVREYPQ
jgi:protein gp37